MLPDSGLLGVRPDLVLVLVIIWSALNSTGEAVLWGMLGGACVDLFSAAPFGTGMLTLGVVSFFASILGGYLRRINGALVLVLPTLLTVVADVLMIGVLRALNWPVDLPSTVALVILPAIVVNTIAGPFVYVYARLAGSWLSARPRLG